MNTPIINYIYLKDKDGEIDKQLQDLADKYTVLSWIDHHDTANDISGILVAYTSVSTFNNGNTSQATK